MALTMTRTRTQATLTSLVRMAANVNGELQAIGHLVEEYPWHHEALARRRAELEQSREALYLTLKQFDPSIDPESIGEIDEWLRPYGRRQSKAALKRYVTELAIASAIMHPLLVTTEERRNNKD